MVPLVRLPTVLPALAAVAAAALAAGCGSSATPPTTAAATTAPRMGGPAAVPPGQLNPNPGRYAGLYCPDGHDCATVLSSGGQAAANAFCDGGATATPATYTDERGAKLGIVCFTLSRDGWKASAVSFDGHRGRDADTRDTASFRYFTSLDVTGVWVLQPTWTSATAFDGVAATKRGGADTTIRGERYAD